MNLSVTTKVTLCPFVALLSPFPCHAVLLSYPCPQVSTDLLSLIIDYFLGFYINRIIQYVIECYFKSQV